MLTSPAKFVTLATALAAIAAIGLGYVWAVHRPIPPTRFVVVSEGGERIPTFFVGLPPVEAYLNGKMFPKAGKSASTCNKKMSLWERTAVKLGLEHIAHAQDGCNGGGCVGCHLYIQGYMCTGACEGEYLTNLPTNPMCTAGQVLAGPSCNAGDLCSCDFQNCINTNCGC